MTKRSLTLEADRVILREIQAQDARALENAASLRIIDNPFLAHDPRPLAKIYVDQALMERKRIPRRRYELAITLRTDRRVIGACSLKLSRGVLIEADLGYIICPEFWNHGFVTEAASRILAFAFGDLGVFRVNAYSEASNPASLRVLEKLGFARTGETLGKLHFSRIRTIAQNQAIPETAHRNL
jgi:ribosomal-protein-alanine N-acetyltransferase